MGFADRVADLEARMPSVRSETAVFVRMEGAHAVVLCGGPPILLPLVGWVPPVAGMTVQVEWRAGGGVVTGPARALSPIGEITATGTPRATVTVDGVEYLLYLRTGYTPTLGDTVTVNWQTGVIEGAVTGVDAPAPPPVQPPVATPFDLVVQAEGSGRYQSSWWSNDPRASNSNVGIWTYGDRVRAAVSGATLTRVAIFLPLQYTKGNVSIGLHSHPVIPGGAPSISSLTGLPAGMRSGWVDLPLSFGEFLAGGGRGVGVTAPGGGDTVWTGTNLDKYSGALRFVGSL